MAGSTTDWISACAAIASAIAAGLTGWVAYVATNETKRAAKEAERARHRDAVERLSVEVETVLAENLQLISIGQSALSLNASAAIAHGMYGSSRQKLLEDTVERTVQEAEKLIQPVKDYGQSDGERIETMATAQIDADRIQVVRSKLRQRVLLANLTQHRDDAQRDVTAAVQRLQERQ